MKPSERCPVCRKRPKDDSWLCAPCFDSMIASNYSEPEWAAKRAWKFAQEAARKRHSGYCPSRELHMKRAGFRPSKFQ